MLQKRMQKSAKAITAIALSALCAAAGTGAAQAGTVQPSGKSDSGTDRWAIQAELDKTGSVTLVPGKTYYLSGGTLHVSSNQEINATGATIVAVGDQGLMRNTPSKANYKSIQNFTVKGGTWKCSLSKGYSKTSIQMVHGKNIQFKDMKIRATNYEGHAIELIACKDVTIENCDIRALGKPKATSVEEMVQIDLAAKTTAPVLTQTPSLANGAACQNITVKNCTLVGNRGLCANYSPKESRYLSSMHKNINVTGNTITGKSSEGVALFNVMSGTVKNNTIISESKSTGTAYSIGCHAALFGKAPASISKSTLTFSGNTIKGGRQALQIYSHSSSKYGTAVIKNNKLYCKNGKANALKADNSSILKVKKSNNKLYAWK